MHGKPRIKISQENEKVTVPGRKNLYRLYDQNGEALCDYMTMSDEAEPIPHTRLLSRHPFIASKRAYVTPTVVKSMYKLYWANGKIQQLLPTWHEAREYAKQELATLRRDYRRDLNPTPYKISVSDRLYTFLHDLWLNNVPIGEIS